MSRALVVRDDLREMIRHLPPSLKAKVHYALEEILRDHSSGKAPRDEMAGLHSYRIGELRIIYRPEGSAIALITVGPRKTVYQKAALELKQRACPRIPRPSRTPEE